MGRGVTYRSSSVRARLFEDALREAMQTPIPESCAVEVPPTADPAAGAVSPEANASKVTGDGGVVDSDPDRAYGDGVESHCSQEDTFGRGGASFRDSGEGVPSGSASDPPGKAAHESARLARLRLWQAQR